VIADLLEVAGAEIDASVVFLAFSCTGGDLGATTSISA
jgi:hypothetical protein